MSGEKSISEKQIYNNLQSIENHLSEAVEILSSIDRIVDRIESPKPVDKEEQGKQTDFNSLTISEKISSLERHSLDICKYANLLFLKFDKIV